ncbi:MAG: filamentous hemagglutinin N-terminal domain-containing protein, partial [Kiloniellaceae bacterium]
MALPVLVAVSAPWAYSHAQIETDGTMGAAQVLAGPNFGIGAGLGTQRSGNLFHSFRHFNINTGQSATFSGPDTIDNVISRVTGGTVSNIDGLLRSTIGTADFFFINPSGVVFGPNASLDVPGSFHVSTADQIRFPDGGVFDASNPANTVLSVADPSAFGFLTANPASITATGSELEVPAGQTLSVVGGNLDIVGGELLAPSGRINLASVSSPGQVVPSPGDLGLEGFGALGTVNLRDGALLSTRGDPGGTVFIRGGRLIIDNSASSGTQTAINSGTTGATDGASVGVDIQVTDDVILDKAEIVSSSFGAGGSGRIDIVAGRVQLVADNRSGNIFQLGSAIGSRVFGSGPSGGISVTADSVELAANSIMDAQATFFGTGRSGDIFINAGRLIVDGTEQSSFIDTFSFGGGIAGSLEIVADSVTVQGGSAGFTGITTQVGSLSQSIENAGDLTVTVGRLEILDGAELSATIFRGPGSAGNVNIVADSILVRGISATGNSAGIFASSFGGEFTSGNAGTITIETGSLTVQERGQVSTFSNSLGNSGTIDIVADTVSVASGGLIGATSFG